MTNGSFAVSHTKNSFSAMGIDQRHEQLNKDVKGDGGIICLTEDEEKLQRWMVCSPEVTRAVKEFESDSVLNVIIDPNYEFQHHEHSEAFHYDLQSTLVI